jgi:hypothetical protein
MNRKYFDLSQITLTKHGGVEVANPELEELGEEYHELISGGKDEINSEVSRNWFSCGEGVNTECTNVVTCGDTTNYKCSNNAWCLV